MRLKNAARCIWQILMPLAVYLGFTLLVQALAAGIYLLHITGYREGLDSFLTVNAVGMQTIAAVPTALILGRLYSRDRQGMPRKHFPGRIWSLPILLGIFLSLGGNILLNVLIDTQKSEAFAQTEEKLFSGPYAVQLLGIVLIIPICEEYIFRGSIYRCLRKWARPLPSALLSSLFFSLFHGNLPQGVYAFILGLFLAAFYERFGGVLAPILIHISANLASMLLASYLSTADISQGRVIAAGLLFCVLAVLIFAAGCRLARSQKDAADGESVEK